MVTLRRDAVKQVNYPHLRYLRQKTLDAISHTSFRHASDLQANRTRLPKADQEAIKDQPLPTIYFSDVQPDVGTDIETGECQIVRRLNRDLSETSMFRCDGLECHDDPFGAPRSEIKCHIFEVCRFREVDRV